VANPQRDRLRYPMSAFDMDVIRDFLRGAVRLHVLHHAALGAVSGAWMSEELRRHGHEISPGTLYPLLHDLEDQGLLVSTQHIDSGRVLRYYEATRAGEQVLAEAQRALAELAGELLPGSPERSGGRGNRDRASR
jgi:DNA-binding PadR family transcriptional regulator